MESAPFKFYCAQMKPLCAVALWVLAVTLMVFAVSEHLPDLERVADMVEILALVPTGWLIVDHAIERERARTDAVIERVALRFAESELTRLHR